MLLGLEMLTSAVRMRTWVDRAVKKVAVNAGKSTFVYAISVQIVNPITEKKGVEDGKKTR